MKFYFEFRSIVLLIFELQICIFGTIANILNIIVLTRKDMSKTPINTILKWLAVTDMFVMIEYIPFSLYMYISPGKYISDSHDEAPSGLYPIFAIFFFSQIEWHSNIRGLCILCFICILPKYCTRYQYR